MATPILIDTDMGVDDAVAVCLALASEALSVEGIASVGGNVSVAQASTNVARLLDALGLAEWPRVARGHDQSDPSLESAAHVFGADGFGGVELGEAPSLETEPVEALYEALLEAHAGELVIVAIGPLTNLAAVARAKPGLLEKASRLVVMGGAVWCKGNVTPTAEFNFYRDPAAAAAVLKLDVPTTVVPLDLTRQVGLDESHAAHLTASGTRVGDVLGRLVAYPLEHAIGDGTGRFLVHDAVAVGALLWPELFLQTTVSLAVKTEGDEAGRCVPGVGDGDAHRVSVLMSVRTVDFLENLLEVLCAERFVV